MRVQYGTVILWRTQNYSVAHPILWRMVSGVRHRIAYLVATILWRTTHAPQNSKMVRHRIAFLY